MAQDAPDRYRLTLVAGATDVDDVIVDLAARLTAVATDADRVRQLVDLATQAARGLDGHPPARPEPVRCKNRRNRGAPGPRRIRRVGEHQVELRPLR